MEPRSEVYRQVALALKRSQKVPWDVKQPMLEWLGEREDYYRRKEARCPVTTSLGGVTSTK